MRRIVALGLLAVVVAGACAGAADNPNVPAASVGGTQPADRGEATAPTPSAEPSARPCNPDDPPRLLSYDATTGEQVSERIVPNWSAFEFVIVDGVPAIPIVDGGIELAYRQPDQGPSANDTGAEIWYWRGWGLKRWAVAVEFDSTFTRIDEVLEGDDEVLVLLGSELGPDHRLMVLEVDDGAVRWTLDGVRGAAPAAAGGIIYDRRVPNADMDTELTREVVVVDDDDPAAVRWTRPSAGELGGHIGVAAGNDVFVVHMGPRLADGYPIVPRPWEVAVSGAAGPDVDTLPAAYLDVADADGTVAAFARDDALWLVDATGASVLADGFTWQVAVVDGVVWAAQGVPNWYCGDG